MSVVCGTNDLPVEQTTDVVLKFCFFNIAVIVEFHLKFKK